MHFLHLVSAISSVSLVLAWTTYVVPHSRGHDDTPALTAAFAANPGLAHDTTILFKKGVIYNILTPIHFPYFQNVIVSVQGNLTYAVDIPAMQAIVESSSFSGSWFAFSGGSNITLEGSTDPHWGWVNSYGQQVEMVEPHEKKGSKVNRPFGWSFGGITNGEIKYMKLWQPIAWSFGISGKDLHIHHNTIIAISKNEMRRFSSYTSLLDSGVSGRPSHTTPFDVQGTNILLEDNVIFNRDDCLMLGSPANNIHFRNTLCNGGHGLSVGPMGKGHTVDIQNVLIEGVIMENSLYGARFKSWAGANGLARNITWKNITISKVRMPIFITQNYWDLGLGSKPDSTTAGNTFIDTFTFQDFRGTIEDNANYHFVPEATGKEVAILDLYKGSANAVVVKDIQVKTLSGAPVTVMCDPTVISTNPVAQWFGRPKSAPLGYVDLFSVRVGFDAGGPGMAEGAGQNTRLLHFQALE